MLMLRSRLAIILGVMIGTVGAGDSGVAVGQPRVRDVWYVYVTGEQRYGYDHTTVRRQEDGTYRYEVEERLLFDLLGQRQEILSKATYVVTAGFEPVSLDMENTMPAGTTRIRGHVEGNKFVLVSEKGKEQRTSRIDMSLRPLVTACLNDWLAGQAPKTTTAKCQVLNELTLELQPAVATRGKADSSGTVWSVDLGPELDRLELTLGPDGICRESVAGPAQLRTRRGTADEARQIRPRAMEGPEILMFPVDKPIAAPQTLTSLTIRLTWKEIPFERFRLEDERQQIVRRSEKEGRFEAVLRIRPQVPADSGLAFPVKEEAYRPFLAETKFIKPLHPEIAKQARAWAGGEKTALGAVRALSAGVFKHMQGGSMIVETLPAPEVLRTRQGKCSEHAILFASLARSLGIPTRIALGMRMIGGSWVGHMWNEAYAGRWITVDSTVNEVGNTAALLKLIDSDSVQGTQALRWAVAGSLAVSVEDFEPRPAGGPGTLKTGIEGPVYTNAEFACRLTAPDKGWSLQDVTKRELKFPTIRFKVPKRDEVSIHFVAMGLPSMLTPSVLVGMRAQGFTTRYQDFKILKNEDYGVHGMGGRIFVFRRAAGKNDPKVIKTTEVLWSDGTQTFLLNLIAPEPAHDEYAADFFKLLESFESLRRPQPPASNPQSPIPRPSPHAAPKSMSSPK